jgi:predicted nucleotidyltransferase
MRITSSEQKIIKSLVKKHFGGNAEVYIFGSRLDNDRKGGDIDLYITTDMPASEIIRRKIDLLVDMEKAIGEQKIDVVINYHAKQRPIYEIAEKEGVKL